ncbi:MAG: AAA family ATPase [Rhizobiales bacterium]|nr:AAA family ATPase [Hyphomicrobiales bacterium]MBO6700344.1 AAA family ATPase [Hyphomicrobiales bacterium]MBO6737491.1 AAA family ATPase [Hyphomicrobiales bacterium]MBO6913452.1 AAA family ATPase [Hyphomicrobiales bacterium]MBO6955383.1 AAA family ATPase [Hyphomicrobiales bacterium]
MRKNFRVTDDMRSHDTLVAARAYTKAGVKLILTHGIDDAGRCTCGKKDCSSAGKHPIAEFFPNGANSATTDIVLIRKTLRKYSKANIATTLEGRTVVDVDGPKGKRAVDALKLPKTVKVKTKRGFHHHFIGTPEDGAFKAEEVDILTGGNRYAMLPPSVHESGFRYRWVPSRTSVAAPVPEKLKQLRPGTSRTTSLAKRGRPAHTIKQGQRNDVLFRTACAIRRRIDDERIILEMMRIANAQGCQEPLPEHELRSVISSSNRYGETREELFGPPIQRDPLPMEWLWYPYFPRFGLTLIAGDPGIGKSLLTSLLLATVTSGLNWPMSDEKPTGNRVLVLAAEDNWPRVILNRLIKAGVNLDNLHQMYKFRALTNDRLELLSEHMEEWRPDLVVVDTLSAYMGGGRDMHRQNEVGEFMALLTEMAEATGSAIVGLAHLNKTSTENPLYRIVGSIGFAASIRSALFFGADPNDPTRVALAHGKSNQSELGRTIIFEKVGGGRDDVPLLKPVGFSDADHFDVCRVQKNAVGRPSSERQAAEEFVLAYLSDEPTAWAAVQLAAEARSIASEATLNIVRAELAKAGRIEQVGRGKKAQWVLGKADADD